MNTSELLLSVMQKSLQDFDFWMSDIQDAYNDMFGEHITLCELMLMQHIKAIDWIDMYNEEISPYDAVDEFMYQRYTCRERYNNAMTTLLSQLDRVSY